MISLSTGLVRSMMTAYGFQSMMEKGVIDVFAGEPPLGADSATPGTPIARITQDGGSFSPGTDPANGLQLQEAATPGVISSKGAWILVGLGAGVPAWFRWYWALSDPQTTTIFYPRVDGIVGSDLVIGTNYVHAGQTVELDDVYITLPQVDIT